MTTFIKSQAAKAVVGLLALAVFAIASSASAAYTFTQNLTVGANSAEVREVQKFLNANGFTVSTTGAGSPGMESTFFGTKTRSAVSAFQTAKGITPTAGFWGALTRAAANAHTGGSNPSTGLVPGCTGTTGFSPLSGLPCSGGSVPPQTGSVVASLSTTNPASGVIVAGQATAKLLDIAFTGSGTVSSVTLKRTGISDQSTLTSVYLYDGVNRLTDGYSFNNNGEIMINNLGLMVSGSRTVSVVADVYASAPSGQTIAIALTNFTSGATASTVNVQGNTMSVASGSTLATVALSGGNSVAGATVNAGTSSYAVWRQSFQVNTRTVWLKAANFRISGSAPADALTNVGLYIDGIKAPVNASMTMTNGSNYLSFDLSGAPLALTTGSHSVEVRADIVKGASFNFRVSLQQASDLMIMDPQVGVNIAVTSFTASTAGQINIGAGSATIVVDPTFNGFSNVTGGASNVAIAKFKVRGYGEDVKVTSIPVTPVVANTCHGATSGYTFGACTGGTASAGGAGLQNVTLYFNGSQVGSQTATWTTGAITFNLGSQLIIPAGVDSFIEVRADVRTSTGVTYTDGSVSANLGAGTGEGWNSKASYTTPTATGNVLTIQSGLLAVSKNTGYANQSHNPNTAGVKIGSFFLQNQSSSESVRVTSLTVGIGGSVTLTNLGGLRTSENANYSVQPQASNVFSVDFTVAPGATKIVDIFADTSSETSVNVITTLALTGIGATSNTAISVAAVTGQTISLASGTVATPTFLSASSQVAQYIAAGGELGAADGTKASFNFVSTGGASTISELKFTVTGAGTVGTIKVGNVTAPVDGSGVAWLTGLNLAVPNGGSGLTIDALISYNKVGTGGVTPGTTSAVALTYVKYSSGGTPAVLTPTVTAPTMTMVGSRPTVTVPVQITPATGLNIGGENKIGEVTVSADAKGNIKINDIQFAVSANGFTTNPTFTSARLAIGNSTVANSSCGQGTAAAASQTIFCEFADAGTLVTTTGVVNTEVNTDYDGYPVLAGGTPVTFNLYAIVNGANTGTNSATINTSVVAAGFNWDDASTNGASGTALTGSLIYNFPTHSYTIKQ